MTSRVLRNIAILPLVLCAALRAQDSELKLISYLDAPSLAWTQDGLMYAAGGEEGASVWSAETDEEIITRVDASVRQVVFYGIDRMAYLDADGKAAVVNIDSEDTERTTLFDSVTHPIQTMTMGHTPFAILFSYGDNTVIEGSQLLPSDEAVIKGVLRIDDAPMISVIDDGIGEDSEVDDDSDVDSSSGEADGIPLFTNYRRITYITSSIDSQRMIAVTDDAKALLVDMQNWNIIQTYDCPSTSSIRESDGSISTSHTPLPQITASGMFALPDSDGGLMLYGSRRPLHIKGNDIYAITAFALSESGNLLATSDGTGMVRIVDMTDGHVVAAASLGQDVAISMAMSPSEKSLLIGTRGGVLYRLEFVPPGGEGGDGRPRNRPRDSINLTFGYLKIQKDYFSGAFSLQSDWRSYQPEYITPWLRDHNFSWLAEHFYYGVDAGLGIGFPSSKYPYLYRTPAGKVLPEPYEWELFAAGVGGVFRYNYDYDLTLFAELMLGFNAHLLFNNNFANAHTSKFDPAIYTGIALGAQWHRVRASFDIVYDTNFQIRIGGRIGFTIPIKKRKKQSQYQ